MIGEAMISLIEIACRLGDRDGASFSERREETIGEGREGLRRSFEGRLYRNGLNQVVSMAILRDEYRPL